jgi:hypothetical protein
MIQGEVVYIGFSDGGKYIHQIISEERSPAGERMWHGYDVNYSRTYGFYLVYNSGDTSMWENPYWSHDPLPQEWQHPEHARLPEIPAEFLLDGSFAAYLEANAIEDGCFIVYCARCKDYLSTEESAPCEHIWYCSRCDAYSKPGERCGHKRAA